MGFIMDLIRAGGKKAGMELDGAARFEIPLDNYAGNTLECWRHGGLWASWANWGPEDLQNPEVLKFTHDATHAAPPVPPPPAATALFVSKWDLYAYHEGTRWREYRDAYGELTKGGREIIDVLNDDIVLADPGMLARYSRIEVPFSDCLDRRIQKLLKEQGSRVRVQRPELFGKNVLDLAEQR